MTPEERFNNFASMHSDIQGHLGFFVDLIVQNDCKTVIECGVRTGVSTAAWLRGLELTGGHLWSVDVDPAPFEADDWTFIQGDDISPEVVAQLPTEPDIVFIDTSHTFEQTCAEIDLFRDRVRPGGWMVFHDTDAGPDYGVRPALDDRFGPDGWVNHPGSSGLGVWQRP